MNGIDQLSRAITRYRHILESVDDASECQIVVLRHAARKARACVARALDRTIALEAPPQAVAALNASFSSLNLQAALLLDIPADDTNDSEGDALAQRH